MLYIIHVSALIFGLGGILIALPNPHLWADSEIGTRTFRFGMDYGGATHIVFGALTMLAFGIATIGKRKTLIFFALAYPISLCAELIGTSTGVPFGDYAYTSGLGLKVLDRVPFTIPLSWFYLGLASYMLGIHLARRYLPRHASIGGVLAGVYLLVVWDLVLDPAMAHEELPVKFWQWFDTGPYFGMPVINFAGWALTGLIFIGAARLVWKDDPRPAEIPGGLPFMIYFANTLFAMVLSLSVDLWEPVVISAVFGLVPAFIAWRISRAQQVSKPHVGSPIGKAVVRRGAELLLRRRGSIAVDPPGWEPPAGPAILVCRHYHHLWDGCALTSIVDRPLHILVGLDWIEQKPLRALMEAACHSAGWPSVLREDSLEQPGSKSAYRKEEARSYLRQALRDSLAILDDGGLLVVFAEAYPNVDPGYTPKSSDGEMLDFRAGFARIAVLAERRLERQIPIVPVGFEYQEDAEAFVTVRPGLPLHTSEFTSTEELIRTVQGRVAELSGIAHAQEAPAREAAVTI